MDIRACDGDQCRYCESLLYAGLPPEETAEVRGLLSFGTSEPHTVLFHAGDASTHLFIIREGQVKLTAPNIKGQDHIIGLVGPGYPLGFDTIGVPEYSYSAETLTPTVLCRIEHRDLMQLLTHNPKVSLNVLWAVNEQLAQARTLIRVLGQKTSVGKVASLLLDLVPAEPDGEPVRPMPLYLSRSEIAQILGLRVETVSRIMAGFRRDRIVETSHRQIVVRNRARLRLLAGRILRVGPGLDAERVRPTVKARPHATRRSHRANTE